MILGIGRGREGDPEDMPYPLGFGPDLEMGYKLNN